MCNFNSYIHSVDLPVVNKYSLSDVDIQLCTCERRVDNLVGIAGTKLNDSLC